MRETKAQQPADRKAIYLQVMQDGFNGEKNGEEEQAWQPKDVRKMSK